MMLGQIMGRAKVVMAANPSSPSARFGAALVIAAVFSCGGEDRTDITEQAVGMESGPASGTGGSGGEDAPDCFENPTSHFEIINACTKALRVEKNPELELLEADGSLPPP